MNSSSFRIFSPRHCIVPLIFLLASCSDVTSPDHFKAHISGVAQKGPFNNGTQVVISSLDENFSRTSLAHEVQVYDNMGSFEMNNISFTTQYVELAANGYYFNEVTGQNSTAPITLRAISDIADTDQININVLTHLEIDRIKYLIANGFKYSEAKRKASKEILEIFGINEDIGNAERLDQSKEGKDNAILLAISIILQSGRPVADLSELLANLRSDLREDGVIDHTGLVADLQAAASHLNLPATRKIIENRFNALDVNAKIPDFETYIDRFVEKSIYGDVMDIDGNIYSTRKIGGLWWMTENLRTTRYADGEHLVDGTSIENFEGDTSTKYYFTSPYMPPHVGSAPGYGYYYTRAAAMNGMPFSNASPSGVQGICPDGWHLPSFAEFHILTSYANGLGYRDIWSASQEIEFNLVLAGGRGYNFGSYAAAGYNWALRNSSGGGEGTFVIYPEHGASVRCIKN